MYMRKQYGGFENAFAGGKRQKYRVLIGEGHEIYILATGDHFLQCL